MKSINDNPIRARDIELFQAELGMTAADTAWALGMGPVKWGVFRRDARARPDEVVDPRIALLIRWLVSDRSCTPSIHSPAPGTVMLRLRACLGSLTAAHFGLSLGCDASAGHRWSRLNRSISPAGRRALSLIDSPDEDALIVNWTSWVCNARTEARLRGIDLASAKRWVRSG